MQRSTCVCAATALDVWRGRVLFVALSLVVVSAATAQEEAATRPAVHPPSADALAKADRSDLGALQAALGSYQEHLILTSAAAQSAAGSPLDLAGLVNDLLLDPERARRERTFRIRIAEPLAGALPDSVPPEFRENLLFELSRGLGGDLEALAAVELGWGSAPRNPFSRLLGASLKLDLPAAEAPIELSVYSLASRFVSAETAIRFLEELRAWSPSRRIAVLVDRPQEQALTETASRLSVELIRTRAEVYSPWPRDPMSFLSTPEGSPVALLRPNRQATRERDSWMGLELIQDLSIDLDQQLGGMRWWVSPIPFHNGNILRTDTDLWISIHSLEPRVLEILGLDRVPVESFSTPAGVGRYVAAARQAAEEMGRIFSLPARFVHPLPDAAKAESTKEISALGGGAGFDLDSLVTLLPRARPGATALVADPDLGATLIRQTPQEELDEVRTIYRLRDTAEMFATRVAAAQSHPTARGLAEFLDIVAAHLETSGFGVERIPLLWVPTPLLEEAEDYPDPAFLLGWNNVVLEGSERSEQSRDHGRAEGFAVGLAGADRAMAARYRRLGYQLELLTPLTESVLRNGGYRCASNHLRPPGPD